MVDLNKVVNKLKKTYKSSKVASQRDTRVDIVSTGNKAFDLIIDGGVPFGYVTELKGLSASGKSLFMHKIMASAQKEYNAICILADRENAYFNERGAQLGINNNNMIHSPSTDIPTVIDCFNFIIDSYKEIREQELEICKQRKGFNEKVYTGEEPENSYIVIGIDSIAAFGKDTKLEKSDSGRKAKSVHEGLREVLSFIDRKTMLIINNQVTYKVGVMFGNPETTTSGTSLQYYSTLRLAFEDRKKIIDRDKGNEVVGNWIGIEVIKTRLGPCYRNCYVQHFYKTGIDYMSGYARLLADRGFLVPNNKIEFNRFEHHLLTAPKGEKGEKVNELEIQEFIDKYPEYDFKRYPEYGVLLNQSAVPEDTKGEKENVKLIDSDKED